jgi:hypothetical protein
VISVCTRHEASIMIDQPPGAAQSLYPDLPSAAPAQKSDAPITPAAQALYGNSKVARTDTQGGSPLGGQAQPGTLLGAPPRAAAEPSPKATEAEPFDPAKVQAPEGVTYDAGLMNEYTAAVKELGLDHKGAARLLDLHTKTQQAPRLGIARQRSGNVKCKLISRKTTSQPHATSSSTTVSPIPR